MGLWGLLPLLGLLVPWEGIGGSHEGEGVVWKGCWAVVWWCGFRVGF